MVKLFEHKLKRDTVFKGKEWIVTTFRIADDMKYRCIMISLRKEVEVSCYIRDCIIAQNEKYKYLLGFPPGKKKKLHLSEFKLNKRGKSKRFFIRMFKQTHRDAKYICAVRGMSFGRYVREGIKNRSQKDAKDLGLSELI